VAETAAVQQVLVEMDKLATLEQVQILLLQIKQDYQLPLAEAVAEVVVAVDIQHQQILISIVMVVLEALEVLLAAVRAQVQMALLEKVAIKAQEIQVLQELPLVAAVEVAVVLVVQQVQQIIHLLVELAATVVLDKYLSMKSKG
jgi:hypothetical protein